MYSLYRAWLSLGPPMGTLPSPPSPPPLNLTTPSTISHNGAPDVSLQVGPGLTHFSAHRNVLSTHSGYFKAALLNHTDPSPISVPNVNVDEFSSLLTFMYTGYLDLNLSNIYNILLATHILHMPRALEICRNFLLQSQSIETRPLTNIIKPIPSRKTILPSQPFYTPTFTNLQKSETTPFKTVITSSSSSSRQDEIQLKKSNETTLTTNTASTSKHIEVRSLSPQEKFDDKKPSPTTSKEKKSSKKHKQNNDKVIIDIACCDGPVRFHRVLNKNYGKHHLDHPPPSQSQQTEVYSINQERTNAAMNKLMSENMKQRLNHNSDENHHQHQQTNSTTTTTSTPSTPSSTNTTNNDLFTCLYCNHTFKSQYCYQKHARRHLNPVTIEAKTTTPKEIKREVKLLDMNVQYYPCKTCGSKFPSYYFVHKHRKLCHADELNENNNTNSTQQQNVESEKSRTDTQNTDSNNSSAIDVEAINNDT